MTNETRRTRLLDHYRHEASGILATIEAALLSGRPVPEPSMSRLQIVAMAIRALAR